MAQSGFTPILLYASGTTTNVPLAANLTSSASGAELALNYADGKLFYKDSGGVVQVLASKAGNVNVSSFSAGTTGFTPSTATTGAVTLAGTLATTNGGTGLTSFTANGVVYASSTSALATGSAFVFDGTNVGIGTASPSSLLNVVSNTNAQSWVGLRNNNAGSSASTGVLFGNDGNAAYGAVYLNSSTNSGFGAANGMVAGTYGAYPLAFITSSAERMRIDSSGNVGIGIAPTGDTLLEVYGANSATVYKNVNTGTGSSDGFYVGMAKSSGTDGYVYNRESANVIFGTANTERMRIDSSGNLLVGTTSSTSGLAIQPNAFATGSCNVNMGHTTGTATGSSYFQFLYNAGVIGSITQSGTTAVLYNTTSDQRLKENIQDAESASALIDSLKVRQFDWKADNSHQRYGFIAQELVMVAPEAVHQPPNEEDMMAVDYSKLVPMLVKEIQSLRTRLTALENK